MKNLPIPFPLGFIGLGAAVLLVAISAASPLSGAQPPAANTPAAAMTNMDSRPAVSFPAADADGDSASDGKGHSLHMELSAKHDPGDTVMDDLIPLAGIVASFGTPIMIVFFVTYFKYRRRQENVALAREYLNKGLPVPAELLDPSQAGFNSTDWKGRGNCSSGDLRKGFRLTFIGLGLTLALLVHSPHSTTWGWGLIPLVMGIGFLLSGWAECRQAPKTNDTPTRNPPPSGNPY